MITEVYTKEIVFPLYENETLDFLITLSRPAYAFRKSWTEIKITSGQAKYSVRTETRRLRQFAENLLSLIKEHGLPEDFEDDKYAEITGDEN